MKIQSILLYSFDGRRREVSFNTDGLNIITGRSSTGKSALSEIVEYCMGRSAFNVPEGVIKDKVSWYGVIYQFSNDQVLIAKPTPNNGAVSCSLAMVRRGVNLVPPDYEELSVNSNDTAVISLLSTLLGIPENKTDVPITQSRSSFIATIQHTYYYLFQKQEIVANKEQLFYRQNEPYQPQTIIDTLPILLGAKSDNRYNFETRLRKLQRDLKIVNKQINEKNFFSDSVNRTGLGLISEAKTVGIIPQTIIGSTTKEIIEILKNALEWTPDSIPENENNSISELESEIAILRNERRKLEKKLDNAKQFSSKSLGFSNEVLEQKSRLESIKCFPYNKESGEWQWPFAEKNLGLSTPIAKALLDELNSLDMEMQSVLGEKPNLDKFIKEQSEAIDKIIEEITKKEIELSSAITANEEIRLLKSRIYAASKINGRISFYLDQFEDNDDNNQLESEKQRLQLLIKNLQDQIGTEDASERLNSIINNISYNMTNIIKELNAEFSEFPFRFDLSNLTIVADRPDKPIYMARTGGGENHLAFHIAALLALHKFSTINHRPIPQFIFFDQPTQVYFPSIELYKNFDGSIQKTEQDADLTAVKRFFKLLLDYTEVVVPGFQIIVTEHANLSDEWFQNALIESPWTKPPALIPEGWPDKE